MGSRKSCGVALGCCALAIAAGAAAADRPETGQIPDFSSFQDGWLAVNSDFTPVPGPGPKPVTFDAKYPFRRNDEPGPATYRVADLSNPNLMPWAKAELKKYNELVFAGQLGTTPRWSCLPGGVPGFSLFVIEPVYIVQSPKEVLLIYSGNREVRHVYLNVPHNPNPKPSWYGESVGHYEGDTLVVDTIGLSPKAVIDNYHTPHTDKLHVIERYHMTEGGKQLEADLLVDDPGTFYQPWQAMQHYTRVRNRPMLEENCSENNDNTFNLPGWVGAPSANKPDF